MNKYDSIQCMNVYSKEYAFPYKEIGDIIKYFLIFLSLHYQKVMLL